LRGANTDGGARYEQVVAGFAVKLRFAAAFSNALWSSRLARGVRSGK
jgi:hypothetical protein